MLGYAPEDIGIRLEEELRTFATTDGRDRVVMYTPVLQAVLESEPA